MGSDKEKSQWSHCQARYDKLCAGALTATLTLVTWSQTWPLLLQLFLILDSSLAIWSNMIPSLLLKDIRIFQ